MEQLKSARLEEKSSTAREEHAGRPTKTKSADDQDQHPVEEISGAAEGHSTAEKRYLSILKQPLKLDGSQKTWRMREEEEACKRGRELWEMVLWECRRRRETNPKLREAENARRSDESTTKSGSPFRSHNTQFFPFLQLPSEIRTMIYEIYCQSTPSSLVPKNKPHDRSDKMLESRRNVDKPRLKILREVYIDLIEGPYEAGVIGAASRNSCRNYADEYVSSLVWNDSVRWSANLRSRGLADPRPLRCHKHHRGLNTHQKKTDLNNPRWIDVDERGNFHTLLPPLALVCTQIFKDMWEVCLGQNVKIHGYVNDYNYRPLFRLCRTMKKLCGTVFNNSDIQISCGRSYPPTQTQADHLALLFVKHWFEGFPLWVPATSRLYSTWDERYYGEWGWKGPDPDRPRTVDQISPFNLAYWMCMLRKTAALWRIDPTKWESLTLRLLRDLADWPGRVHGLTRGFPIYLQRRTGPVLIEETVSVIARHAQMALSGVEHFILGGEIQLYGKAVGDALRAKLGSFYEKWEWSWANEAVPDDGTI